ncbi:DUF1858 domain-containing protein [Marinovum sp.]|uniref:DUF1858 domain-containing protein n=1 Tax=Marinovum sp. TaxID=2024839 RepID=UPI003A921A51
MPRKTLDDPDLPLSEMMRLWPETVAVFVRHRMLCVGCLITPFHTRIEACAEYGLEEEAFLAELRAAVAGEGAVSPAPAPSAHADRRR